MKIVALSDQHGFLPEIQPCDLLIVAGDVCPDRVGPLLAERDPARQKVWFDQQVRPWLARSSAAHKVLTWGNHDWCGQECSFANDSPAAATTTALQILVDDVTSVPGNGTTGRSISIWASPWSNRFQNWAFMKSGAELVAVYAKIPDRIDILVSHQPPYGYGDRYEHLDGEIEHLGSRELLAAIERIRPRLVVCGHLHGGHGYYEHEGIPIYNVSVVNDQYQLIRPPTVIDIDEW